MADVVVYGTWMKCRKVVVYACFVFMVQSLLVLEG